MVEKTPILDTLTYLFLMLGIVVVGFPIIYSIIAATLTIEEVSKVPMPLVPGDQFWVNIQTAWEKGNLGTNLVNSFIMAAGITLAKLWYPCSVHFLSSISITVFEPSHL